MSTDQQFFNLVSKLIGKRTGLSSTVDNLDRNLLLMTPEAMIVTVVMFALDAQAKGQLLSKIIQECERGRRQLGHDDDLLNEIINFSEGPQGGAAVELYCHYRLKIEFPENIQNTLNVSEVIEGTIAGLFPMTSSNPNTKKTIVKKPPTKKTSLKKAVNKQAVEKKPPEKKISVKKAVNKQAIEKIAKEVAEKNAKRRKQGSKISATKTPLEPSQQMQSEDENEFWGRPIVIAWFVFSSIFTLIGIYDYFF